MSRADRAGLFNVNRSVTSLGNGARRLRLPAGGSCWKSGPPVTAARLWTNAPKVAGGLPEMETDLDGLDADYAVANVRRSRSTARQQVRAGWTHWMSRMAGAEAVTAVRP